jgi:Rieske Fe-S protein
MGPVETRNGAKPEPAGVPRRKLLGWLVGIINAGVFAAVLGPVAGFIGWPLKQHKEPGRWIPVLDDAALQDGETKSVTYQIEVKDGYMMAPRKYSVFVSRKGRKVCAYDPTCPHLGCHVEYKDRRKRYVCPCHGGVFDEDGSRVSGPPPRGLTKIATKVADGRIWVYRG